MVRGLIRTVFTTAQPLATQLVSRGAVEDVVVDEAWPEVDEVVEDALLFVFEEQPANVITVTMATARPAHQP